MRALFAPWARSRRRRVAASVAASITGALAAFAIFASFLSMPGGPFEELAVPLLSIGFALGYFGVPILHLLFAFGPRPRPREVDVVLAPGEVRVPTTGHVIRARDVLGASSAAHDGGFVLHVDERRSPGPHAFVVRTEEELDALRRALGVGHDGSGAVDFPLSRDPSSIFAVIAAASTFMCSGLSMPLLLVWPFLKAWPRAWRTRDLLTMTPSGVVIGRQGAAGAAAGAAGFEIPYDRIGEVRVGAAPVTLQLVGQDSALLTTLYARTMREDDARRLASQIETAARRSRGGAAPRTSALDRIAALRRAGQSARDWLARVDASDHLLARDGYRAAPIDPEDLRRVLDDPTEAFEDRLAAGRFLVRAEGEAARVRVEESLLNARVDPKRVRVALEAPPEEAAEAFEAAEAEAERAQRLRR